MSYTLQQVTMYGLSETRRSTIYDRIRVAAATPQGELLTLEESVGLLKGLELRGKLDSNELLLTVLSDILQGATVEEYALYTRIEVQRIWIRMEENALRLGKSKSPDGSLLRVCRADFKSLLKLVQI